MVSNTWQGTSGAWTRLDPVDWSEDGYGPRHRTPRMESDVISRCSACKTRCGMLLLTDVRP